MKFRWSRKPTEVEIGTRVRSVGRTMYGVSLPVIYQVVSFFEGTDGIHYARLQGIDEQKGEFTTAKTVAAEVLLDQKLFEIVDVPTAT
jgi:hypothetical protein